MNPSWRLTQEESFGLQAHVVAQGVHQKEQYTLIPRKEESQSQMTP